MITTALLLAPIFALVVLGNILRRNGLPGDGFWPMAEKLGYYVMIPSLLFHKISTADIDIDLVVPFGIVLGGAFYTAGIFVLLATWLLKTAPPQRASVLQGAVRHNGFLALAVAERLYGSEGLAVAALCAAVLALITNLSLVPVLVALNASGTQGSVVGKVVRDILRNPIILSICAGLLGNVLLPGRVPVLHDITGMLGSVALPLMLLCVGAGLRIRGLKTQAGPLAVACFGRFIVFPLVVLAIPTGLSAAEMAILMIFATVPTAPSSSALAAQTGGDVPLMNAIVTLQTLIAFASLPASLALAGMVFGP